MDDSTLECCLISVILNTFVNKIKIIARDELADIKFDPLTVLIINTDVRNGSGGLHWVGLIVCEKKSGLEGHTFDSYARPLSDYKINVPFPIKSSSTKVVQSNNSRLCGLYTINWIYWFIRGRSTKEIEAGFSTNLKKNDSQIFSLYRNLYLLSKKTKNKPLSCCTRLINKL